MLQQDSQTTTPQLQYYLALIEDTTKLSDRRQTANDLFVGLNVVIFTGMGALFYGSHLKTWWVTGIYAAVTVLALCLNITWLRLNGRYRRLISLRINYMTSLETELKAQNVFPHYPERAGKQKNDRQAADGPGQTEPGTARSLAQRSGIFAVEYEHIYYRGTHAGFARLERTLIWIFIAAYVLATLGAGVATYLITQNVIGHVAL